MSGAALDDLDDELLALANDGVESEEEGEASSHHSPGSAASRSPSRSLSRSPSPRRSKSRTLSRSPRPASASDKHQSPQQSTSDNKMSRSKSEGRRKDESEEEGEASSAPGSPDSMGSVAMDESDSEASDAESSGRAMGETAFERERRLAEQAEREEERQKTLKLKALIGDRDAKRTDSSKPAKRKAEVDEDDYGRRSSRQRTKNDEDSGRRAVRRKGLSESPQPDSFADDSQAKRNDGKQPGTLPEYERVRMGRTRFASVCFTPGFEDTFTGAFARVCSSQDPMTGQNTYRMCQIKAFVKGKPYKLDAGEGQFFMTDQYVVASYGTLNKEYPFNACSDTKFSEDEFHRRVQNLDSASMKLTTSSFLTNKCKDINQFLQAPRTSAEISQKLANQSRLAHLNTSSIAPAVGQNTLQRDLALHKRNLDNRKLNEEQVRKALIADRRRRIQFAETNARKAKEEEERKKKAEEAELWGGDDDADDTTPAADAKAKPVSKYVHRDYKNGLNDFTRVKTDDEIIASMDLGIDIDIDI